MAAASNFRGTYQVIENPQIILFFFKACISPTSGRTWGVFEMFKNKKPGHDAAYRRIFKVSYINN